MAKRSTRIEVTKTFNDGTSEITLSKSKMNRQMCDEVIKRLSKDCESLGETNTNIKEVKFKCVE
jgi:hypothetical protein